MLGPHGAFIIGSYAVTFLVVGGLLAAFGVLSGVLGIVRPNLPDGLANALMGIGAVLVVGTMISVIAT